jgi:hypothetical protein
LAYKIARIGEWAKKPLFRGDVRALDGDGAFHQQNEKGERAPERGEDDVRVEIGKRRGLLLAQVFEGLQRHPPRGNGIAGELEKAGLEL